MILDAAPLQVAISRDVWCPTLLSLNDHQQSEAFLVVTCISHDRVFLQSVVDHALSVPEAIGINCGVALL